MNALEPTFGVPKPLHFMMLTFLTAHNVWSASAESYCEGFFPASKLAFRQSISPFLPRCYKDVFEPNTPDVQRSIRTKAHRASRIAHRASRIASCASAHVGNITQTCRRASPRIYRLVYQTTVSQHSFEAASADVLFLEECYFYLLPISFRGSFLCDSKIFSP